MRRLRHLGLQRRIMLYVGVGLAVMFGSFAVLGLRSVQEATQLVYQERLSTAYTTAGILERDFLHVARDVGEASPGLLAMNEKDPRTVAQTLLAHLSETDPFPFFRSTGVWVVDAQGQVVAGAGSPDVTPDTLAPLLSAAAKMPEDEFVVLPAMAAGGEAIPFATVLTRATDPARSTNLLVAVHTVSVNSSGPYVPTSYWLSGLAGNLTPAPLEGQPEVEYHLEVVTPEGLTVLGIGEDERAGERSRHFPVIQSLTAQGKAAALLHEPVAGESFKPHVMAVVPLPRSSFYVVLEQPTDTALSLPAEIRERLLLLTTIGFLTALLVAWITTRHVVKPTERLTAAARRIAEGEVDTPISVAAEDEIEVLAQSLETMRLRLQAWGSEMEKQVRSRTSELEEKNRELGVLYETLQRKEEQLHTLLGRVLSAQEDERKRVSRELHDAIGQALSALTMGLERLQQGGLEDGLQLEAEVQPLTKIAKDTLGDLRRLTIALRPAALDDLGLVSAVRRYGELYLGNAGVECEILDEDFTVRLDPSLETVVYRVVQEAINNIARHSGATRATIRLQTLDGRVAVAVADNGSGFDPTRTSPNQGIGLQGMAERASLVGGTLVVDSVPGRGTTVRLDVPLAEKVGVREHG